MEMEALLGKPPRMTRDVKHEPETFVSFDATAIELKDAAYRLMRLPTIADKTFLISIGDRSVGGMTTRDHFVHHRCRNQERESHAQRYACRQKTNE